LFGLLYEFIVFFMAPDPDPFYMGTQFLTDSSIITVICPEKLNRVFSEISGIKNRKEP
jgi:hypothetical protein